MQQLMQQVKNDPQMVQRVMQSPDGQKLMQLLTSSDNGAVVHAADIFFHLFSSVFFHRPVPLCKAETVMLIAKDTASKMMPSASAIVKFPMFV